MKNSLFDKLKNTVYLKITGKNILRFIKRLNKMNIELLEIKYLKYNEIIIKVKKQDLNVIEDIKTIYEIETIGINGIDKIKEIILKNKYLIFSFIAAIIILYMLCDTIFQIDVIHNDNELRELLEKELQTKGIEKYKTKKSYDELQIIKKEILDKYREKIEWLEIESIGTKYSVRVEERIITKEDNTYIKRNIIAKKDARIIKVEAKTGEVIKFKNEYVHKGDVVISGTISLYDNIKTQLMAEGKIYGEVWYKATVEYPLNYKEETKTGKIKNALTLKLFNKEINLDFNKFKNKQTEEKTLLKHHLLPIELVYQRQYQTNVIDEKLTKDEAVDRAVLKAKEKIMSKLNEKEYIISVKKLKVEQNNSKIIVEVFIAVCEDITDYEEILEQEE